MDAGRRAAERRSSRSITRVWAATTVGAIVLTGGCSMIPSAEEPATRVLQSVDVSLNPSGEIRGLEGTALFVNEATGGLRSESVSYEAANVVDDLPVRVVTRYRTDEGTGDDLHDLAGYSGGVEIEIALENLTVAPENLSYDAVGQARTSPALVGVPLSIAATATLPQTAPSGVVFDTEAERRTNGVVSTDGGEGTLVQWGTLLAPPQTEATTTLRLVADVRDFTVPDISVSVQAGVHTDLSFAGTLASAIDTSPGSALGQQRQTIELVADVNDVLTRAGATITDVRKNLDDTSKTLGTRASQRLGESSTQLTAQMQTLGTQIDSLQTALSGTASSTSSAMEAELSQIMGSMSSMLGKTNGTPPRLYPGKECAATLGTHQPDGTVYSMFLYLSSLLDGYADASERCKELILDKLDTAVGPETPSEEFCREEQSPSATCALFDSQSMVGTAMEQLAERGAQLAQELQTDTITQAQEALTAGLIVDLGELRTLIETLQSDTGNQAAWDAISERIDEGQSASASLKDLRAQLTDASQQLVSIVADQREIASDLCALNDGSNTVDPAALDALSIRVSGEDCAGALPEDAALVETPQVELLQGAIDAIDAAALALDPRASDSPIARLDAALTALERETTELIKNGGRHSISPRTAKELLRTLSPADDSAAEVQQLLDAAMREQTAMETSITDSFARAADDTRRELDQHLGAGISAVNAQRDASAQEVSDSYAELITSLRASAERTVTEGKTLIDDQQSSLADRHAQTRQSLNERTTTALSTIEQSTQAATKNVEGASAQLTDSLNKVLLDLGDPRVKGSGILGAMSASAAKSGTADFQLAEASQHAAGYANVRDQDISVILMRNAQFKAALEKGDALPPFHLSVPDGSSSQTVYSFHLTGGGK